MWPGRCLAGLFLFGYLLTPAFSKHVLEVGGGGERNSQLLSSKHGHTLLHSLLRLLGKEGFMINILQIKKERL